MASDGAEQLRALGLRLKAAGDGVNRRNLLTGIRTGAQPLVGDVRAAALAILPHSGGLAAQVAASPIAVRTRLTGPSVGVRIVNTKTGAKKGGTTASFGTDRGSFRHPVFGRKTKWVQESCTPGWFTGTLERRSPETAPFVLAAMKITADFICAK